MYCLSSKNYIIKTESGNSQRFAVLGSGVGLQVSLSSRVCNFGEVKSMNSTSRLVTLENNSEAQCSFKFFTDSSSIFLFKKTEGVIKGKSNTRLVIFFSPKETVSYYQRMFCVVKNHLVLYIDLIGTCYDILQRPLPLSQKDIEAFRNHVLMGTVHKLVETAPNLINQSIENVFAVSAEIPMDEPNQIALHKEMFQELSERMIALSEEFIDFRFTLSGRTSEGRNLVLSNRLQFPVHVLWLIPGETQPEVENPACFSIRPSSASIPAESSMNFTVFFSPNLPGGYFFQYLRCQAYIKRGKNKEIDELGRMSTSQTYGKDSLNILTIPPIPLSLPVIGHSFPSNYQTFIPEISINPKKIKFPPCSPGDTMYQSIQIFNQADTPCYYQIVADASGIFKVFPPVGFILPKTFTILAVEFKPKVPQNYKFQLNFLMNHASSSLAKVSLEGVCSDPSIFIDNEAKIFYPPLYTGVSSKQKVGILNSSHIAIDFNIEIPEKHRDELTVEPFSGTMYPHEKIFAEFNFTPLNEKNYRFNVPIRIKRVIDMAQDANFVGYFNPGSGKYMHNLRQDPLEKMYTITVIGTGGTGMVQMNPKNIDFKTVSVGFSDLKSFTLSNVSNCAIYVKLVIVPKELELKNDGSVKEIISSSFIFDFKEGILAANSNQKVNLRFVPNCRSQRDYYIQCMAKQSFPNSAVKETPLNEDSRIELSAHGDFPVITILDLRNKYISPSVLWKQFDLKNTIKTILSPLTSVEIKFNNAEIAQNLVQEKLCHFDWDFGKLNFSRNTESKKMKLTLQNIGGVKALFKFVFPDDNKLEKEAWADTGDPEPAVALEEHILEQRIFEIKPKEFKLEIGEKIDVELKYNCVEIGQHCLNIFFQIIHGKPIVISLKGETLPQKRGFLELRHNRFEFEPQPIGLGVGITQPIELRNVGDNKINYEVNTSALTNFTKSNFDFSIFDITNKEGIVEASELSYLFINFKPLESKSYKVTLPIIVKERNTQIQVLQLEIEGRGYHPLKEAKPIISSVFEDLPLCRNCFLPESSLVGFSIEEISFGKVEYGISSSRIVIIYNKSPNLEFKFTFKETAILCGDDLILDPVVGTVIPGSQLPIKLTLNSNRIPTIYEGELECMITWENINKNLVKNNSRKGFDGKEPNLTESIFLRIRKESSVDRSPMEIVDSEPELLKNIFREAIQSIISEDTIYNMLENLNTKPLEVMAFLSNDPPASLSQLHSLEDILETDEKECEAPYSNNRLFLLDEFKEISNTILENTLFNIISEAIYQESDLCSIGKTYIRVKPSID